MTSTKKANTELMTSIIGLSDFFQVFMIRKDARPLSIPGASPMPVEPLEFILELLRMTLSFFTDDSS